MVPHCGFDLHYIILLLIVILYNNYYYILLIDILLIIFRLLKIMNYKWTKQHF